MLVRHMQPDLAVNPDTGLWSDSRWNIADACEYSHSPDCGIIFKLVLANEFQPRRWAVEPGIRILRAEGFLLS